MNAMPQPASESADLDALREKARLLRIHSLRITTRAGSGHPTTCLQPSGLANTLTFGS